MKFFFAVLILALAVPVFGLKDLFGDSKEEVKKAIESNPAPSGFAWIYVEEINAGLLQPVNWIVNKEVNGDSFVVTISEDSSSVSDNLRHELRLVFTPGKFVSGTSTKVAKASRDSIGDTHKILYRSELKNGSIDGFNCIYSDDSTDRGTFVLFQGNWMTNSLYQIEFGTPRKDFDRYFKSFGIPMVNFQIIDQTK